LGPKLPNTVVDQCLVPSSTLAMGHELP